MDTPSSSSPKPDHEKRGPLPVLVVSDRAITEKASFELGVVRKERTKMKRRYEPKDNFVYGCTFCICSLKFSTLKGLRDHLTNHHQTDLMLERKNGTGPCPEWPKPYDHYQYNLNNFICKTSSKCKYLETSLEPSKLNGPGGGSSSSSSTANPSFNGGVTDMSMTVNPCRSLTSYASSSKGPFPYYNCNMNDNHVGLSSGPFESARSGSTSNTSPWFTGESPGFRYSYLKNILSFNYAWRDVPDLELSLGPSKSIGDNNNALNNGVTIGTISMNMPLRPRVSRFHYANGNPLDSINSFNDLSSVKENVSGSSHSDNHSSKGKDKIMVDDDDDKDVLVIEDDDDNDKDILVIEDDDGKDVLVIDDDDGKDVLVIEDDDGKDVLVIEDDDKDIVVIEDDDDMDVLVIEDDDAKSWGLDLSLSH